MGLFTLLILTYEKYYWYVCYVLIFAEVVLWDNNTWFMYQIRSMNIGMGWYDVTCIYVTIIYVTCIFTKTSPLFVLFPGLDTTILLCAMSLHL